MDILDFFWTFYLNHLSPLWGYFFVNGESTPRPSFKLDVGNGIYLQGLNSLYKITGKTIWKTQILE